MLTREEIESREERDLAPYAMKSKDSRGRKYPEKEHYYRGIYQRDRDRIIHSTAFRRLEYKTQVFVNHEGDYYRTRLTHTIEVSQIARTIARALNLNEDLAEAIALAHDLGHTPFGHSGEDALKKLMEGHGGFEHNLHGLRVVDILEQKYPDFPGLNLSWELKESIVKHKSPYDNTSVSAEYNTNEQPLLEAQIVDKADSIAYDNHDLDDSLKAGIITHDELLSVELWRETQKKVKQEYTIHDHDVLIAQTIKALINIEVIDLLENTVSRIKHEGIQCIQDVRKYPGTIVSFSPLLSEQKKKLQQFLFRNVYQHYRVARMADKAKRFLEELFTAFIKNPKQLPLEYQKWIEKAGLYQGVCDYIAGMTDRFAQDEYKKLFYPYERV
ncbi:MAG: deoxyguanosinetriphosphate triphosphohydrolase [Candidatus Jettenia sp.]|uniref:Deoxyguanosinetriphosphate triphosphohydrolase-like protein n=1 Tax=Candidatus Jettenia caeni TaxID=247490 RepID=I3IRC1_9BACT|nr:deoxyguanosinetriphosphate triphosphohydrolase [Candidatus Jettenia sp. AMX1]MBC6929464.1 deoxyguanosinetriphosphate triphosphohydrolase [Candidatus Jettenia sp.]WKZ15667.1 MAG: deoxyguanosinetriphosphate triphosphohydrolase [Candidatus Jettenia caeni]KAA0249512.1 MAG: deoxyguanosinetriphosphate triphosphohydrolase [Candidatus Jettenia sp. AMX1]MCE7880865.1 deoxyguanosinetriphosphate triphosphohydrolase [Candidatus Jettenia sp. AMX1]MCQ3927649.1 deoxyguanosinetriphosphate triphosphohydrolas